MDSNGEEPGTSGTRPDSNNKLNLDSDSAPSISLDSVIHIIYDGERGSKLTHKDKLALRATNRSLRQGVDDHFPILKWNIEIGACDLDAAFTATKLLFKHHKGVINICFDQSKGLVAEGGPPSPFLTYDFVSCLTRWQGPFRLLISKTWANLERLEICIGQFVVPQGHSVLFTPTTFPKLAYLAVGTANLRYSTAINMELPTLQVLQIQNWSFSSSNLRQILSSAETLPNLTALSLDRIWCEDFSILEDIKHPNLESFSLFLENYEDTILRSLAAGIKGLKKLKKLAIVNSNKDEGPGDPTQPFLIHSNLSPIPTLRELKFIFPAWASDSAYTFTKFARQCAIKFPNLQHLEYGFCFDLSEWELKEEHILDNESDYDDDDPTPFRICSFFDEITNDHREEPLLPTLSTLIFTCPVPTAPFADFIVDGAKRVWANARIYVKKM